MNQEDVLTADVLLDLTNVSPSGNGLIVDFPSFDSI